jgi:hypothetical protein
LCNWGVVVQAECPTTVNELTRDNYGVSNDFPLSAQVPNSEKDLTKLQRLARIRLER